MEVIERCLKIGWKELWRKPDFTQDEFDADSQIRYTIYVAAIALGVFRDPLAVPLLVSLLHTEPSLDSYIRVEIINALGNIGGDQAVDAIAEFTNLKEKDVCFAAIIALGTIGDSKGVVPISALLENWCDTIDSGKVGDDDFAVDEDRAHYFWKDLLQICKLKKPLAGLIADALMDQMTHSDAYSIQAAAALVLGILGDSETVPVLLRVLKTAPEESYGGDCAAIALGMVGDANVIGILQQYLHHAQVHETRHKPIKIAIEIIERLG